VIAILQHIIPIALGFIAKLMALKAEDNKQRQEMMIKALSAQNQSLDMARKYDTPAANASRRMLIWFLMILIGVAVLGYAVFNVPIFVEEVRELPEFLFFFGGGTETVWTEIKGIPAYKDLFTWMTLIFELYFGASLARRG